MSNPSSPAAPAAPRARAAAAAPAADPAVPTHLIGASRLPRFRRSGLQFTKDWQSWPIVELRQLWGAEFDAKLAAVFAEGNVLAELVNAKDAAAKAKAAVTQVEELSATNAELVGRIADLEARLAVLEAPKG